MTYLQKLILGRFSLELAALSNGLVEGGGFDDHSYGKW